MHCNFIPDDVLNRIGDILGLKVSNALRKKRSGFKRIFQNSFFPSAKADSIITRNRETYDCKNSTSLPGELKLIEQSPLSSDLILNTAHVNSASVFNFFASVFNRLSLDGKGMTIKSCVHYDKNYNNAFWNGEQMVYGDGDGKFFISLTKGLDVCAHEMAHAVTQFTCNLWYMGQSGALNESFSDIMGIACKHWVNKQFEPEKANWLMGDEIVGPDFPGKAIRSFKNEKAYDGDPQPKHMSKYVWTSSDNFGVHINSSIPNRAFYELCLILNKPSYDKPSQIVYNAHIRYLKSWSNFKDCAKAQHKSALELYGNIEAQAVKEAWAIVGIKI